MKTDTKENNTRAKRWAYPLRIVLLFFVSSLTVAQLTMIMDYAQQFAALHPGVNTPGAGFLVSLFGIVSIVGGLGYDFMRRIYVDRQLLLAAITLAAISTAAIVLPNYSVVVAARVGEVLAHIVFAIAAPAVAFSTLRPRARDIFMSLWGIFLLWGSF